MRGGISGVRGKYKRGERGERGLSWEVEGGRV
jgi:hypothetical protein